ncbi:hypothetical protein CATRI_01620 [Corynebacterium atrinae]|uniref:hypothetical protein n=1 Tax=Corynebacterium atrinae TaxID=1336740 RepID=UPI0025B2827A|nr:hypothetical protein [Corynebacterium atrinae]WJY62433.1 hypothetical protein CATRI_01620 [Corynebacterium atrinae]
MAELQIDERQVTVTLNWWEKIAAHRSHLTVPARAISGVRVVDDALAFATALERHRHAPGTRVKGVTDTGTFVTRDGSRASVLSVCHGTGPGVVIDLSSGTISRIIISTTQAEEYAKQLGRFL